MAFQTKTYKAPNKLQRSHSSRSPVNTGHTDHTSWSSARERTFKGQGLKRRADGLKWSNTPVLRSLPRGEGDQARMLQLSTENGLSKQFCTVFTVFLWFKVLYAFKQLGDFAGRSLAWSPGRSTWVSGKKITLDAKTELRWREKLKAVAACSFRWKYRESRCNGNDSAWKCIPQQFLAKHKSIKPYSSISLIISKKNASWIYENPRKAWKILLLGNSTVLGTMWLHGSEPY